MVASDSRVKSSGRLQVVEVRLIGSGGRRFMV
jgi:hypothetical protein